jgi:hypothetical protein
MAQAAARQRNRASGKPEEKPPEAKPSEEKSSEKKASEEKPPEVETQEKPPERKVRPRSEVEQETMVARNRDEIPERFLGRLKCPGCHRVIEVQTRNDLETMKIHVRNRAHGSLNDCVRIEPAEGIRDS